MNRYGQYCPMARASQVLGDRWTLLIVRDLLLGTNRFNDLERGLPGIPRALLADRLRFLQQAGVIERRAEGGRPWYALTRAGEELQAVVDALTRWGARWAFGEPEPDELDPELLLWWMRDRIHSELIPRDRVVVEIRFYGKGTTRRSYWLVLSPEGTAVCLKHPGFDSDLFVRSELATIYEVWVGRRSLQREIREGRIEIEGNRALARAFPTWLALSPLAPAVSGTAAAAAMGR